MKQIIYKCLNKECGCEFKDSNRDGLGCPKCKSPIGPFNLNPTNEEVAKVSSYEKIKSNPCNSGLVVTVSLTNTEQFEQAVALLAEFIIDNRISNDLKEEYKNKYIELLPNKNSDLLERVGWINVSLALIKAEPEAMLEAFKDVLITDVKFDIDGILHYRGVSKHFEIVKNGEKPPVYNIICSRNCENGEEKYTFKYEKVS